MLLAGGALAGIAALLGAGLIAWFLWSILSALLVGAIARAILPGADAIGWPKTILVGFLGGILGNLVLWIVGMGQRGMIVHFLGSIGGAMLLLVIMRARSKPKATA